MNSDPMEWTAYWRVYSEKYQMDNLVKITEKHRGLLKGRGIEGSLNCQLSGKLEFGAQSSIDLPSIGDWCEVSPPFDEGGGQSGAIVLKVLERDSMIARNAAGRSSDVQILASNVDYAFVVSSANEDFNINRIHRYVFTAETGGVAPVILVSKSDLIDNFDELRLTIQKSFPQIPLVFCSAQTNEGIEEIGALLNRGKTGVFLGSSGVGKSSLVNALLGKEIQLVSRIREADSKGRHTTTSGRLFFLESGGMIIDTPGLRELQLQGDVSVLEDEFEAINHLAEKCRYRDCSHIDVDGCAVTAAISEGELEQSEWDRYHKMKREILHQAMKSDRRLAEAERKKWKSISKFAKSLKKKNLD